MTHPRPYRFPPRVLRKERTRRSANPIDRFADACAGIIGRAHYTLSVRFHSPKGLYASSLSGCAYGERGLSRAETAMQDVNELMDRVCARQASADICYEAAGGTRLQVGQHWDMRYCLSDVSDELCMFGSVQHMRVIEVSDSIRAGFAFRSWVGRRLAVDQRIMAPSVANFQRQLPGARR